MNEPLPAVGDTRITRLRRSHPLKIRVMICTPPELYDRGLRHCHAVNLFSGVCVVMGVRSNAMTVTPQIRNSMPPKEYLHVTSTADSVVLSPRILVIRKTKQFEVSVFR